MASSELAHSSSIKAYQSLPRKPVIVETNSAGQVSEQVARIERRLSQRQARSEDIASWISDQSQTLPNPNLPLTPPTLSIGSNSNRNSLEPPKETEPEEQGDHTNDSALTRPGPATPTIQRSPPTPDQTPPQRGALHSNALKPGSPESRKPSSTAGSFRTALEGISTDQLPESEQSFHTPDGPQARSQTSRGKAPVGLGLGLEPSEGSRTPTMHSPRIVDETAMADPWIDREHGIYDDPFTAPESMAVREVQRENIGKPLLQPVQNGTAAHHASQDFQSSFEQDPLKESSTPPTLQPSTPPAQQTIPPTAEEEPRPTSDDSDYIRVDKQRLSGLSAQSQVVQAIVLSTPKQRRQKLRHSSKNESLRAASSPVTASNRSSLASAESKPRALHRAPKMSDWGNRVSLNSDSGISMGSDMRNKAEDALPTYEIPGLRSSLRRSSERERTLSRKFSDLARRDSKRRPLTAPEGEDSKGIDRSPRRRSNSMANAYSHRKPRRDRKTLDYPPEIPPRNSSLSAPTSQHNSRTASLTSSGRQLKVQQKEQSHPQPISKERTGHNGQADQRSTYPEIRVSKEPTPNTEESPQDHDIATGQSRSMLLTPFSGVSVPTSTQGSIELNEATVVNIFPHSNTSVLVVQQLPQQGSDRPRLLTSRSGNVSIKVDEHGRSRLSQPPQRAENFNEQVVTTRHPQPPAVMVIPPTPASAISNSQKISQSPSGGYSGGYSGRYPLTSTKFTTVRRVLSTRRYSESLLAPFARPIVARRDSGQGPGRSPKLSPFWRPKAFWNDVTDNDETEDEPQDLYVRNTLGMPQLRLIPGPGSLSRRIGSLRRRKQQQADEAAKHDFDGAERRVGILVRLRNTKITPFVSLADAIEKLRSRRAETLTEKERDRLRRHIGPPVLVSHDGHSMY